jgi:hypothetical protein
MDQILPPRNRRTVWQEKLAKRGDEQEMGERDVTLGQLDRHWVQMNCELSFSAVERLATAFNGNPLQV